MHTHTGGQEQRKDRFNGAQTAIPTAMNQSKDFTFAIGFSLQVPCPLVDVEGDQSRLGGVRADFLSSGS